MTITAALRISTVLAALILGQTAAAETAKQGADLVRVEGEAPDAEALRLLTGLSEIRADLKLGLLMQAEGLHMAGGSPFAHAQEVILPGIAEGLAAAGAPDLAPLLQALAEAKGDAVKDAYHDVEAALMKARSVLNPPSALVLKSVVEMSRAASERIDASGTTPVADYQMAWQLLMVARGELDLLMRDQDRAVAKSAGEDAMAFDDLILFMPDPNQSAPVAFDRALILDLIAKLEAVSTDA